MNWVLDLDGVVWLADTPITGSAAAVRRLQASGAAVVFVTNNSNPTEAEYEAKLARHGIDASGAVISSAMAVATLIAPETRVLACAGPGVLEALDRAGAIVVDRDPDAVVIGFHREFDYERMRIASSAVRDGARFLATNDDATYPTPDGLIPGAGSILASVERASGRRAEVAGKPNDAMAGLVRSRVGDAAIVVGDRPDTDGLFAMAMRYRFALVMSGVVDAAGVATAEPPPDEVAADLSELVDRYLT